MHQCLYNFRVCSLVYLKLNFLTQHSLHVNNSYSPKKYATEEHAEQSIAQPLTVARKSC